MQKHYNWQNVHDLRTKFADDFFLHFFKTIWLLVTKACFDGQRIRVDKMNGGGLYWVEVWALPVLF